MQNKYEIEKTFIREDGTRLRATATLRGSSNPNHGVATYGEYTLIVHARKRGSTKWDNIIDTDGWDFRRASFPEGRKALVKEAQLQVLSADEIDSIFTEVWEKLKPEPLSLKIKNDD
ncbi:hypothetical protein [Chitinophaga varians]|uniref:hypothetical protein n=1 Tax=Chitinophaga varians TaxID=2202339 RepID=UPI00165FF70C|nr:hypothetical protein [Chitinophaga varians]MBC9913138.1 hypothetical protein [Chitinophaga varians]